MFKSIYRKNLAVFWTLILIICANILDVQFRNKTINLKDPTIFHLDEVLAYIVIAILLLLLG